MESLTTLKKYLQYGKIKLLAEKAGIEKRRAWDLLSDRIKPKDSDMHFINSCIDAAKAEKIRIDEVNKRLTALA